MGSVLVTCGATVPFPALVKTVLDPLVVNKLKGSGYERIIVQYGRGFGDDFTQFVKSGFDTYTVLQSSGIEIVDGIDDKQVLLANGVQICGFEFCQDIERLISDNIALVISHAGTGSILDSLRLNKKLIVVVNDTLMDNHQQLIADKFEQQNLLWAVHADTKELTNAIERSQKESLSELGSTYNKQFEDLLYKVAIQ